MRLLCVTTLGEVVTHASSFPFRIGRHTRLISTPSYAERESQTAQLPDGRQLGFAEYGDRTGRPLFYFHGTPGSRLEVEGYHYFAARNRIRIIAMDRPGIGLSTFQPMRKHLDWPKDVESLANMLKIDTFRVLGCSGGGPYALACAYAIPERRLKGVGVLCGAGHNHRIGSLKGMNLKRRLYENLCSLQPRLYCEVVFKNHVRLAQDPNLETMHAQILQDIKKMNPKDRKVFADQENFTYRQKSDRAAFIQGLDGHVHERILSYADWAFDLRAIKIPVHFWHGDEDNNCPIQSARYLAARVPGSKLTVYPGDTHNTVDGTHERR